MIKESQNIIHFLKAESGDCFLLQFADKNCILIDGGYKSTFRDELKPLLKKLAALEYRIRLFVVTHFDEDHIGGAIELIKENGDSRSPKIIPIDNIWFNGIFELVLRHADLKKHLTDSISKSQLDEYKVLMEQLSALIGTGSGTVSAKLAENFETLCKENNYVLNQGGRDGLIVTGSFTNAGKCKVKCINPNNDQLDDLCKWISVKESRGRP